MSVSKEPLNIRNNNPGNLRFVGQEGASQGEGGFAKFETPQAGLDAMRNQIELDTQKRGLNLTQFLNKYAPPSENKTTNYIDFVARKTGLDPSSPIPASAIPQLQAAMIEIEGGPRSLSYFTGTAAQATPAQAPRTTAQRRAPVAGMTLAMLPDNYRIALATSYLGETEDPEEAVAERAVRMMEEAQGGGAAKIQKILAQAIPDETVNPFKVMAQAQASQKQPSRAVPRMPRTFAEGGEASLKEKPEDDAMNAEERDEAFKRAQDMLFNMRANVGPVMAQFVPGMGGVDVRASTQAGPVRPYVDVSPNRMAVSQVGATYGNVGPQGGYEVGVSKRAPMQTPFGRLEMPVTAQGSYTAPVGKMGQVQAQGYYVPRQGQMPQVNYGANLRYVQRFQEGGEAKLPTYDPFYKMSDVEKLYKTERGSTYAHFADQTSQRNRSGEKHVDKTTGMEPRSLKTIYVDPRAYNALMHHLLDTSTGTRLVPLFDAEGRQTGRAAVQVTEAFTDRPTKVAGGKFIQTGPERVVSAGTVLAEVPYERVPVRGHYPVEIYSQESPKGKSANIHFGNKIVEIVDPKVARPTSGAVPRMGVAPIGGSSLGATTPKGLGGKGFLNMAEGGEVNYDQMAEQMTVGTLLPPEQYIPVPMVRPGVSVPTMSEVPRVDAQGRVIREAPTPDQVYTPLQRMVGGAEALGTVASGLTAPASILYDVARGVPAKEISPGRFMYEPRTEAGQEYTQGIGRLAQDLKLDVALPQVQLQRPYPVGAMARQAADIATGPIDRAKIRAAASRVPEDVAYDPLRERLESQGILSLAVKPGGGVVNTDSVEKLLKGSAYNVAIERYERRTGEDGFSRAIKDEPEGENIPAIMQWIDTKARDYFSKQYGSPRDPLFRLFQEGKFTPLAVKKIENEDVSQFLSKYVVYRLKKARELSVSDDPKDQAQGRLILTNIYDKVTPINIEIFDQTARARLINPQYRNSIADYIRQESDLGPEDISVVEMDAILDKFAKTGKLPPGNPFDYRIIFEAVKADTLDNMARQIETQGGIYTSEMGRSLPASPTRLTSWDTLSKQEEENAARGEPVYSVVDDVTNELFQRKDVTRYLLDTPKEQWEKMSFPEVLLQAEKAGSKTMDPIEIADRIDNYRKVTPEQRFVGTTMALPLKESSLGKGAAWREITDPGGVKIEGRLLKHCFGLSPKYESFLVNGESKFFALRDKNGKSYVTIQIDRLGQGKDGPFANIHQVKGFRNSEVGDKYASEIMQFLNDYEKKVGVPLRYTEGRSYLPPEIRKTYFGEKGFAKGGMVDKPLYDRAV